MEVSGVSLAIALMSIPVVFICTSLFVKITVVFHILRNALGLQTAPSTLIINTLGIVLSLMLLGPLYHEVYDLSPEQWKSGSTLTEEGVSLEQLEIMVTPIHTYLSNNVSSEEESTFFELVQDKWMGYPDGTFKDIAYLAPAYIMSELNEALELGVLLYLPFLIIDTVVTFVLLSMGAMMVSPIVISTPIKIALFYSMNGLNVIVDAIFKMHTY